MKKKSFFINSAMLVVMGALIFSSCKKDDTAAKSNTITDVVVSGSSFTTLESAVIKADLQAAGFTSFARKAPQLVANQHESDPDPAMPQSPVADK